MSEPSRLLAGRPGLSRPEKEAILERVLADVAPRRRPRRWFAVGALAAAAAAAAGVFVLLPGVPRAPRDEFTARGGAQPPSFEVSCVPAPCAVGSKLVFDVTATGGAGYFAAFARHEDTLIWYFPATADARSLPLPPGGGVLDTGIVLGAEHAPGSYRIDAVFSPAPLDRAAIRAAIEHGGATVERAVVIR